MTALGLLLFCIPFILVFCFEDKLHGFLYVFTSVFAFHIILAIVTQALHVFYYPVIVSTNCLLGLIAIILFIKFRQQKPREKLAGKIDAKKINWLAILAFLIIFFELWSVHFNYTGPVEHINGQTYEKNQTLKYPYYSDEWIGVAFTKYSIESHSLPTVNPLDDSPFVNTTISHFSLLAELFLLFGMNPLTGYAIFALMTGMMVCLFVFLLLRANLINNYLAIIITLSIPFVVNNSYIAGIWYLTPFITGLIFLLVGMTAFSKKENVGPGIAAFALSFLLYPPMLVFISPIAIFQIFSNTNKGASEDKTKMILAGLAIFLFISSLIFLINLDKSGATNTLETIWSHVWRANLSGRVANLMPWLIVPIYILPLAIAGIYTALIQKKYVIALPLLVGIIFWIGYTFFTGNFFVIDIYRVVAITSIFITITAGFGLEWFISYLHRKFGTLNLKMVKIERLVKGFVLLIFFVLSFFYTRRLDWMNLTIKVPVDNIETRIAPVSPATRFLTDEDLTIFASIHGKRFLAEPWKALTVAVATDNYPVETKASTVWTRLVSYYDFIDMDCSAKKKIVDKYKIEYLYTRRIDCPFFEKIAESNEVLALYRYTQQKPL